MESVSPQGSSNGRVEDVADPNSQDQSDTSKVALVTGASTGIGLELAKEFLSHGYDVIACADEPIPLDESGGKVRAVSADLRTADGVEALWAAVEAGRPLDAAALIAGVGQGGAFVDQDLDDVLSIVDLNVRSTVHLARLVLGDMVARGRGRVLMASSIASMMPGAYQAAYNASKSFLQSFAQGVEVELRGSGVTVTSLMPGPTDTKFFRRAEMADNTKIGRGSKDDPAQVAAQGFAAMQAGKRRVVGGGLNTRMQYTAGLLLPDIAKSAMHSVIARPR